MYDYQDITLKFDFTKYDNVYLIAYSAGVFVASILGDKIPNVRQKVALCGNPYLFDAKFGISAEIIDVLKNITLDNYLDFRRKYMVASDEEYRRYNQLESLRTIESCKNELKVLQKLYTEHKGQINPVFNKAIAAEKKLIFNLQAQKEFYKDKLRTIPQVKHHIFFKFNAFEEMPDME